MKRLGNKIYSRLLAAAALLVTAGFFMTAAGYNDCKVVDLSEKMSSESFKNALTESSRGEYVIGAGDLVKVFVYENPEYTENYRVGPDGKISLPIIGTVPAAGLTRDALAGAIKDSLSVYLANPVVNVIISEYMNNYIYALGDVARPGRYDFRGDITLMGLLPQLGDVLKDGGAVCDIIRDSSMVVSFRMSRDGFTSAGRQALDFKLKNSDIIYFTQPDKGEAKNKIKVYAVGRVRSPGVYYVEKGPGSLASACAMIEKSPSAAEGFKIIRNSNGRNVQLDSSMKKDGESLHLRDGDILYAPEKSEKSIAYCLKRLTPHFVVGFFGYEAVRYFKK